MDYDDLPDWANCLFWAVVMGVIAGGLIVTIIRIGRIP